MRLRNMNDTSSAASAAGIRSTRAAAANQQKLNYQILMKCNYPI
jgi:hypothetical protein